MDTTILIVDDNTADQQIMARLLKENGFKNLSFAATAQEGYTKALEEKPDVIIMDTVLPDKDGFSLCYALSQKKGLKSFKVLLTGHVQAIDTARASEAGADKYIVKTSNYRMLLTALEKLVDDSDNVV